MQEDERELKRYNMEPDEREERELPEFFNATSCARQASLAPRIAFRKADRLPTALTASTEIRVDISFCTFNLSTS